ncbi:DUF973 family protein [Stygiolobus caldivivus]|uniref:Archaeal Type IV pilin N-terminal domain-containing protein n=1 Tax=Stygiolobus caldivivus TaxID=2824673 RepID=A0A8D5U8C9_9CREN|nr:DUF973 family protein [Stygiolobus caldivivus]BCU70837.1 hypothetical protein KN1_21340 [Stygiolobus caldivivus]
MSLRKALKAKRSKKGLSGAVTALILVIASVIIALVVVGFAFGLFGALGGTPTVTQVGSGSMEGVTNTNGQLQYYQATFTLHTSGPVSIESVSLVGTSDSGVVEGSTSLTAGANTITVTFPTGNGFNPQPGTTYQISVGLSDGSTVQVAVQYTGYTVL